MQQLFDPTAGFNELVNWQYAKMAELWGGNGYFCDTCEKLYPALLEAKNNTEFSLIEFKMFYGYVGIWGTELFTAIRASCFTRFQSYFGISSRLSKTMTIGIHDITSCQCSTFG